MTIQHSPEFTFYISEPNYSPLELYSLYLYTTFNYCYNPMKTMYIQLQQ